MNKNKIYACMSKLAIATMIATSLASTVYAANGDLWMNNEKKGTTMDVVKSSQKRMHLIQNRNDYTYELDGKLYKVMEVDGVFKQNPDTDQNTVYDIIKANLQEVGAIPTEDKELKVESVSAINAKQVEVKFSKAVKEDTVINSGKLVNIKFDKIGTAEAITSTDATAKLSKDGKVLTITAADGQIFKGRYTVTVDETKVKDVDGNPIAKYSEIKTFEDKVRPSIVGVEYSNNGTDKIAIIEFTEPVDLTKAAFSFKRADGVALDDNTDFANIPVAHLADSNNKKIVVVFDKVAKADENKDIKVTITGLTDYAGNLITPNPAVTTIKYDVTDTKAPKVESVTVKDNNTLVVKFDKALAVDPEDSSFAIKASPSNTASTSVTKDKKDATKYEVKWDAGLPKGLQTVVIPAVKNLNGVESKGESKLINIVLDEEAPALKTTKVEKINGKEYLVLTYDENVTPVVGKKVVAEYVKDYVTIEKEISTSADNFTLYNSVNDKSKSVKLDLSDLEDSAEYTAKLPEGLVTKDINGKNSEEKTGVKFTRTADVVTGEMKVETFKQNDNDNNIIDVTFNKKVDPQSALNKANYSVEGVTIESVKLTANPDDNGKATVELKLAKGSSKFTGARTVVVSGVKNEAGQVMETYNEVIDINENIAPIIEKAELTDTDKITVTFSEAVYGSVENADKDFELYVGGVKSAKTLSATTVVKDSADDELVLTVSDALTAEELAQGVTIKFVKGSGIKDIVDNKLDAPSAIKVTVAK